MEMSTRNKRNVNLREEFLALFKKMQQADPNFAVVTDNDVWTEASDIPVNDAFLRAFKVNLNKPNARKDIITMYFSM